MCVNSCLYGVDSICRLFRFFYYCCRFVLLLLLPRLTLRACGTAARVTIGTGTGATRTAAAARIGT